MTDDLQQLVTDPQTSTASQANPDPLASLEELLQKAKAKRAPNSSPQDDSNQVTIPQGPSEEELKAQQLAEQQSLLAQREKEAEVLRQQQLEEQRKKMATELQNTPEYMARQEQHQEEVEHATQAKAAQLGHVIHQVSDAKI